MKQNPESRIQESEENLRQSASSVDKPMARVDARPTFAVSAFFAVKSVFI